MLPSIPVHDPANLGGFGTGSDLLNTFATNPVGAQALLQPHAERTTAWPATSTVDFSFFDFLTYRLNLGLDGAPVQQRGCPEAGHHPAEHRNQHVVADRVSGLRRVPAGRKHAELQQDASATTT